MKVSRSKKAGGQTKSLQIVKDSNDDSFETVKPPARSLLLYDQGIEPELY